MVERMAFLFLLYVLLKAELCKRESSLWEIQFISIMFDIQTFKPRNEIRVCNRNHGCLYQLRIAFWTLLRNSYYGNKAIQSIDYNNKVANNNRKC